MFDNLYYVGEKMLHGASPSAWAVTTSEGIILIDTMFEDSMKAMILGGFTKLNLDPANLKYILITHGHGDHLNGTPYLQTTYKPRVIMGGPDWDALDRNQNATAPRPTRDISGVDGQKVTLGDTTDHAVSHAGSHGGHAVDADSGEGRRATHVAALWGGTGMQFSAVEYNKSAVRFRDIVASRRRGRDPVDASAARQVGHQAADDGEASAGRSASVRRRQRASCKNYMTVAAECSAAAVALPAEYQGYLGRGGGGGGRGGRGATPAGRGAPAGRGQ